MCGLVSCLKKGELYTGVIVRQADGHKFFTRFNNNQAAMEVLRKNLIATGAVVVETITGKTKEDIKKIILRLNKEYGLPGINNALQKAS